MSTLHSNAPGPRRGGVVLIVTFVALLITLSIAGTLLSSTLRIFRQCRIERQQLQLPFLCEAGAMRFAQLRKADKQFRGDQWEVSLGTHDSLQAIVESKLVIGPDGKPIGVDVTSRILHPIESHSVQMTRRFPSDFSIQPRHP